MKYHQGFSTNVVTPGGEMHVALAFNPSHLEIVNPVAEGSVEPGKIDALSYKHRKVMPVVIHGDAAAAGQGVVMETFQMSQTRGYRTGGTITSSSITRWASPQATRKTPGPRSTARKSQRWFRRPSFT